MLKNFDDLYQRYMNGQIEFREKQVYFTQQDRSSGGQASDASSEGCTVYDKNLRQAVGVLHIHIELAQRQPGARMEDVITKAHIKNRHDGSKLFDLDLKDNRVAIVIQTAYGSGYSIYI